MWTNVLSFYALPIQIKSDLASDAAKRHSSSKDNGSTPARNPAAFKGSTGTAAFQEGETGSAESAGSLSKPAETLVALVSAFLRDVTHARNLLSGAVTACNEV